MTTNGEKPALGETIAELQGDIRLPDICFRGDDVTGRDTGLNMMGVYDVFGGTPPGLKDREAELIRLWKGGVRRTLGAVASEIESLTVAEFDGRTTERGSERLLALLAAVSVLAEAAGANPPRTTPISQEEMKDVARLDEGMFGDVRRRHPSHRTTPRPRNSKGELVDRFGAPISK